MRRGFAYPIPQWKNLLRVACSESPCPVPASPAAVAIYLWAMGVITYSNGVIGCFGYYYLAPNRNDMSDRYAVMRPRLCSSRTYQSLYVPSTWEQWLEAIFHSPDWLIHVSLQITERARCVPLKVAS